MKLISLVRARQCLIGGWLLLAPLIAVAQGQLQESQAIARVQQIPASQLDPALPARPFGKWLEQIIGSQAGVNWQLTDCGGPATSNATSGIAISGTAKADIRTCLEMTAILANDRMVAISVMLGAAGKAGAGKPQIYFIGIEDRGELMDVKRLSNLPAMLRRPVAKRQQSRNPLPPLRAARMPLMLYRPRPSAAIIASGKPPALSSAFADDELIAPAKPKGAGLRVSEGALLGSVISKYIPAYPLIARQISATGEVQVQITIGEDGHVIEAVATSGHPMLRGTAEDAARRWVFKPTMLNNKPVRAQGTLTFVFSRQ